MSQYNSDSKDANYWTGMVIPAVGAVAVQQSVLGYYASSNKLPPLHEMKNLVGIESKLPGDTLPFRVFGRPGLVAAVSGIAAGAVGYALFHPEYWQRKISATPPTGEITK